jgi:hypothetical protein
MSGATVPMWRDDPDRWAERRAQFIRREFELDYRHAITLAYSELGFSSSGIAARTQFTENTIRGYLDQLANDFGQAAVWAKLPDAIGIEAAIGPDDDGDDDE